MKPPVLIDTGPLVAVFNQHDAKHKLCISTLATLETPLLTTWPIITEAAYLIRSNSVLVSDLLKSVDNGFLQLAWLGNADLNSMVDIFHHYRDQNFQVADLSLMHLANRDDITTVFTLDNRDFSTFRKDNGNFLNIVP